MTTLENKAIPLIVVEEHHEAFYAWSYARAQRWLGDSGHVLLHVDAHADSMLPRLRRPLHSITDLASCADFVYHELDISTFIWPAVYQGLFCRILWLKHNHRRSSGGWQAITVYSKNSSKTEFGITGASLSKTACRDRDAVTIEYSPITTHDVISTEYPIVLDIDLDYFCSNDYPDLEEREIEITQEAFDHFHANPYHFLRISPLDKISAVCRNNRYFLVYNDYYPERPSTAENLQTIETRLTGFIEYLQARAPAGIRRDPFKLFHRIPAGARDRSHADCGLPFGSQRVYAARLRCVSARKTAPGARPSLFPDAAQSHRHSSQTCNFQTKLREGGSPCEIRNGWMMEIAGGCAAP